ncbi:FAD-dependent oxidoreductase [Pseudogracilibacillus sp. ICA-222130]|uniref:FAD-dependent oxidoreductase n=1 Tax=Pseudogracilibacillus sp. ICA-222130 TaxID=3134655 RepID=UPI0030BD73B0
MNYVIIGGDAAGMSAAMQIFKYDERANITIIERGEIYSYAQCGLPYVLSGDIAHIDDLVVRTPSLYRKKFGMNALTKHEATAIDEKEKIVTGINHHTGESFSICYDKLLIATGANPNQPSWEGMDLSNVFLLKDIPDLEAIMAKVDDGIERVTIIGGGYVGLEVAESFCTLGKHVTLINRGQYVGKIFDEDMATYIHEEAKKHGIHFVFGENTEKFAGTDSATHVITDKTEHETDLVIVSIGVHPNTEFLPSIQKTKKGAIIVNERMETNIQDIYAAGDCATQFHRVKKVDDYIPLGTNANKQGRIAGMNMVGVNRTFKGIVGSSILKFMDLTLGKTGLTEKDATAAGFRHEAVKYKGKHIAAYFPGAEDLYIKLVYEKDTNLLLGGQVIGKAGVDKRIDVIATALYNEMTMEELEELDLSYAPPYNGVWDPIQKAARRAT